MGHWKGSALSIMIDLLVSVLSGGATTHEIGSRDEEYAVSQLFAAFDLGRLTDAEKRAAAIADVAESLRQTLPIEEGGQAFYPGQRTWMRRLDNLEKGIPVDEETWEQILVLAA
jgi:3-dehydro-L-gulonate 2-dehydrogenase